jgi:lipopolysaccharide biosynthesis protein
MPLKFLRSLVAIRKNTGGIGAALSFVLSELRQLGAKETAKKIRRFVRCYGSKSWRPRARATNAALRAWHEEVVTQPASEHATAQRIATANGPGSVRAIAFFLPQYHPFKENDQWWGAGFTEWRNVTRAFPCYVGHYQPRLPADLGFYDLRTPGVLAAQADMARKAGLSGFCFYFYWFDGKPLMDTPLALWKENKTIEFPFCLCWANENWTRRWDGLENSVLISQQHSPEDDLAFIGYVSMYLDDPRYIAIDGKPLLIIYRPGLLPDARGTIMRWREWWRRKKGGDIYVACVHAHGEGADKRHHSPALYGCDASIEFPPVGIQEIPLDLSLSFPDEKFLTQTYDYTRMANASALVEFPDYKRFRCVMPTWDNTARRRKDGVVFHGSSPNCYRHWLHNVLAYSRLFKQEYVFINAWNEWAEGAYLEPDLRYGYAYLNATAESLSGWMNNQPRLIQQGSSKNDIVVLLHLHYPELIEEFRLALADIDADVWITLNNQDDFDHVSAAFPTSTIFLVPNRGRDIAPFIALAPRLIDSNYKICLKLHSKRSPHRQDGDNWRTLLVQGLLPNTEITRELLRLFAERPTLGAIAPPHNLFKLQSHAGSNQLWLKRLQHLSMIDIRDDDMFPAGSMYWFRPKALATYLSLPLMTGDFEFEDGQVDGTLAHALERFLGACLRHDGYETIEMPLHQV